MNKKTYQMPCVKVVNIKIGRNLLAGSPVTGIAPDNTTNLRYGGASGTDNPNARGRGGEIWDDDEY